MPRRRSRTSTRARASPPASWRARLNDRLPADINVLDAGEARLDFHSRRAARGRTYRYQIATRRTAFLKTQVYWVRDDLDPGRMSRSVSALTGRHDFTAFADWSSVPAEDGRPDPRITVSATGVEVREPLILFRISAGHFLPRMVRRLAGLLIEIGRGDAPENAFAAVLSRAGGSDTDHIKIPERTVPPSGLFLERVDY